MPTILSHAIPLSASQSQICHSKVTSIAEKPPAPLEEPSEYDRVARKWAAGQSTGKGPAVAPSAARTGSGGGTSAAAVAGVTEVEASERGPKQTSLLRRLSTRALQACPPSPPMTHRWHAHGKLKPMGRSM